MNELMNFGQAIECLKQGKKIANGGAIEALGSIRMLTADKKILTGWLASQTDILSEDWIVVEL